MKKSAIVCAPLFFSMVSANNALSNDEVLPDLLGNLISGDVQHLTTEEAADIRGESIRKEESQYGYCGLRRCTRMFVNDKHLYTVYDDGSVYFVRNQ